MGYTHYWTTSRRFTDAEWLSIMENAAKIITTAKNSYFINVAWDYDEPTRKPEVSFTLIRFNGIDEDGHETFYFENRATDFAFCKTNHKDYDAPAVAILMYIKHRVPEFSWRSDGWVEDDDTQAAVKLVNEACGLDLEITNADPNSNDPYYKEQG